MTVKRNPFVSGSSNGPISRREALRRGVLGSAAVLAGGRLGAGAEPASGAVGCAVSTC